MERENLNNNGEQNPDAANWQDVSEDVSSKPEEMDHEEIMKYCLEEVSDAIYISHAILSRDMNDRENLPHWLTEERADHAVYMWNLVAVLPGLWTKEKDKYGLTRERATTREEHAKAFSEALEDTMNKIKAGTSEDGKTASFTKLIERNTSEEGKSEKLTNPMDIFWVEYGRDKKVKQAGRLNNEDEIARKAYKEVLSKVLGKNIENIDFSYVKTDNDEAVPEEYQVDISFK